MDLAGRVTEDLLRHHPDVISVAVTGSTAKAGWEVASTPRSVAQTFDDRAPSKRQFIGPSGTIAERAIGQLRIRAPMPLRTNLWKGRVHE